MNKKSTVQLMVKNVGNRTWLFECEMTPKQYEEIVRDATSLSGLHIYSIALKHPATLPSRTGKVTT